MSKSRNLAALLDSSGDVVAGALDNAGGGGGAWEVISSQTVTSAVSSVDFTGMSGYDKYQLMWSNVVCSGHPGGLALNFSTDDGSTWHTGWFDSLIAYSSENVADTIVADTNSSSYGRLPLNKMMHQYNTNEISVGQALIYNMHEAVYTHVESTTINDTSNGYLSYTDTRARLATTSVYNSITMYLINSVNFTGGTFTLYGIKNS